jgi:hypothetical protein
MEMEKYSVPAIRLMLAKLMGSIFWKDIQHLTYGKVRILAVIDLILTTMRIVR